MKTNKSIDTLLSAYLVLTGILSLFFLIVVLLDNHLELISLIAIFFSLILLVAVVIYSGKCIFLYSLTKERFLINSVAAFLQTIYIAVDGFQFKYMQGMELLFYAKMYRGMSDFRFGLDFSKFSYAILIKNMELNYTSVGIDVWALCLLAFYTYQYKIKVK